MKIIKANDYEDMSELGALFLIDKIKNEEVEVIGLATGGTPVGLYKRLIRKVYKEKMTLSHLHTVNLDEYIGLSAEDANSYHQYMDDALFKHIDIPKDHQHLPNGDADDISMECERYEQLIQHLGGVDLQLLGIGDNGHIGFNEPGSSFNGKTKVVDLAPSTIEANARYFSDRNDVPLQAITMGVKTIMESKSILLIASGEEKAAAVKDLIQGQVSEDSPATVLQTHPNITIIADEEALSLVTKMNV